MAPKRDRISHADQPRYCRHCGGPIYTPDDPEAIGARPIERRVYSLMKKYGERTREQIFHELYGADPSGGPNLTVVDVVVNQLNKALHQHGMVVRRKLPGVSYSPFKLFTLAEAPPAARGPRKTVDKPVDK